MGGGAEDGVGDLAAEYAQGIQRGAPASPARARVSSSSTTIFLLTANGGADGPCPRASPHPAWGQAGGLYKSGGSLRMGSRLLRWIVFSSSTFLLSFRCRMQLPWRVPELFPCGFPGNFAILGCPNELGMYVSSSREHCYSQLPHRFQRSHRRLI